MGDIVYRARYISIDSPENDMQLSGDATRYNADLIEGQTVILASDVSETDRFCRLQRYFYLEDGTFVNAELVRAGYAEAVALTHK